MKKEFNVNELCERYNINLEDLKQEQKKLAKGILLKDAIDFELAENFGAIENSFFENKIISGIVLLSTEMEILEQEYFSEKIKFPYLAEFRAYRELPNMIKAFQKLEQKPDVVFVNGEGIAHPRLGIASHFSISTGIPTIGVSDSLLAGEIQGEDIILDGKKVGKVLQSKFGSRPLYISPGNLISLNTSFELAKKFIIPPHKFPEPLHIANKYAKSIKDEIFNSKKSEE